MNTLGDLFYENLIKIYCYSLKVCILTKFRCSNLTKEIVLEGSVWEAIRTWRLSLHEWDLCPYKKYPRELDFPSVM
jgi:hypothetical protein